MSNILDTLIDNVKQENESFFSKDCIVCYNGKAYSYIEDIGDDTILIRSLTDGENIIVNPDEVTLVINTAIKILDEYSRKESSSINGIFKKTIKYSVGDLALSRLIDRYRVNSFKHPNQNLIGCTVHDIVHPCLHLYPQKSSTVNHVWIAHLIKYGKIQRSPAIPDDFYVHLDEIFDKLCSDLKHTWKYHKNTDLSDHIQAYIKIVDIEVESDACYQGVWHLEGVPEEHIALTGLYYLPSSLSAEIQYKRYWTERESSILQSAITANIPPDYDNVLRHSYIPLGKVCINSSDSEITMVCFPNTHIHKVQPTINKHHHTVHRQFVAFFIVDQEVKVPDWSTIDLSKVINTSDSNYDMALHNNMHDRKTHKQTLSPREIDFCEH